MLISRLALSILLLVGWPSIIVLAQQSEPQVKAGELHAGDSKTQQHPTQHIPTTQEIADAVTNGIDSAAQKYEARHPAPPPDNSTWWFNLFLVIFTGGLVGVGIGQCYLFFHTLRATRKAADAAAQTAQAVIDNERPLVGLKTPMGPQFEVGKQIVAKVIIQNAGRTPAVKMKLAAVGAFIPAHTTFAIPGINNNTAERVLLPNVPDFQQPPELDRILTADEATKLRTGELVARIAIRIEYYGLAGTCPYRTNISLRLDWERQEFVCDGENSAT